MTIKVYLRLHLGIRTHILLFFVYFLALLHFFLLILQYPIFEPRM